MTTDELQSVTSKLGKRQVEVLRLMASNYGGTLPLLRQLHSDDQRVAASLAKYGLVEDVSWLENGEPEWKITDDGRIAAERTKAGNPEICFCCDERPAVYVKFSGAQTGKEIGYPSASLLCQGCYDDDREQWPDIPVSRTYRMTPVDAA